MNILRLALVGTCLASVSTLGSRAWAQADAPAPAPAPAPLPSPSVDITTLRTLRDRGTITPAEYEAAMKDIAPTTGERVAGDSPSLVVGRWSTTLYGFAEA